MTANIESVEKQMKRFAQDGFVLLKSYWNVGSARRVLKQCEAIQNGTVSLEGRAFSLDPSYTNDGQVVTRMGYQGDVPYRKINDLEFDPIIFEEIKQLFDELNGRFFDFKQADIVRCVCFNKPPGVSSRLDWHQDVAKDWPLSGVPSLALWLPLDNCQEDSGTLEVMIGSHRYGLLDRGHTVQAETFARLVEEHEQAKVIAAPGDVLLFSPYLVHASGTNQSMTPRRAINVLISDNPIYRTQTGTRLLSVVGPDSRSKDDLERLTCVPR